MTGCSAGVRQVVLARTTFEGLIVVTTNQNGRWSKHRSGSRAVSNVLVARLRTTPERLTRRSASNVGSVSQQRQYQAKK